MCFCLLSGFGTPLNYICNQENNNPDRFALAHVIPLQSLWWGNCYTYTLQGLISDIVFEQILWKRGRFLISAFDLGFEAWARTGCVVKQDSVSLQTSRINGYRWI